MVSAHPQTIDTTRQPPKLGDFFSPYQQQQQPSLISNNYDNMNISNNGYENINFIQGHRPQSVTNLPLRQQNQNNALARQQSQQPNRRSPLLNAPNNNNSQFVNPLGRPPPLMSSPTGFLNQENPQLLQNRSNSQNSIPKNPKLYKTELCRSWMDHGRCNYGERCQYAHGTDEKRQIPRHPKYKTEACSSYHKTGYCPYGPRCHFIHNEDPALLRQLIAQNAAAMGTTVGIATPQQQQSHHLQSGQHQPCQRQYSTILPIGSRPSLPQTPQQQQQQYFVQKQLGSDGESPIPSSTDSGSESPLGSFSPGLEESLCRLSPTSFRRSLSTTTTRWSPTSGIPTFSPANSTISTTNISGAAFAGNIVNNNIVGGGGGGI
uniref:C3H1-type domain-containing protein n=1 Tax=Panagrolaimus sp. ES5 TaxID=591445 RepID=A0AC34G657_9BILA